MLFDLGVSSMQFDDARRGFSFAKAAPLDMRMDPHAGRSAYDVLATASESELADIFFHYGEERAARRIARAIVERRDAARLPTTTTEFAALVSGIVHRPGQRERIHPGDARLSSAAHRRQRRAGRAARRAWTAAIGRLRGAGRVVAISFHSLEDRIVKQTFRDDERLEVLTKQTARARRARDVGKPPRAQRETARRPTEGQLT